VRSIRAIVRDGALTVLLVEQRVDIALELSDRCVVMDRGRGVFEGASSQLADDEAGLTALMGLVH
jgi:branched-chain amino acid transport system ATP-binding protein